MITSAANEKIKHLIALRDKAKVRREEGLCLVEGIRMLREIPPADLEAVFASEDFYKKNPDSLPSNAEILDNKVFAKVSAVNTPQGVIAIVKQKSYSLNNLTAAPLLHCVIVRIQPSASHTSHPWALFCRSTGCS